VRTGGVDSVPGTRKIRPMTTAARYALTADENTKTWTAVVVFDDREIIVAEQENFDGTLRGTAEAAVRQAAEYLREGLAGAARIDMWKNTKARGLERDRQAAFLWAEDGRVYVDKTGL
jgi:hypothetical protein